MRLRVSHLLSLAALAACGPRPITLQEPPSMTTAVWRLVVRVAQADGSAARRSTTPPATPTAPAPDASVPDADTAGSGADVETSPRLAYDDVDDWADFWEEVHEAEAARPDPEETDALTTKRADASLDDAGGSGDRADAGGADAVDARTAGIGGAGGAARAAVDGGVDAVATRETADEAAAAAEERALVARIDALEAEARQLEEQIAAAEAERVAREAERREQKAAIMNNAALSLWTALMIRRMQLARLSRLLGRLPDNRTAPTPAPFGGVPTGPSQPVPGAPQQQPFGGPQPNPGQQPFGGPQPSPGSGPFDP